MSSIVESSAGSAVVRRGPTRTANTTYRAASLRARRSLRTSSVASGALRVLLGILSILSILAMLSIVVFHLLDTHSGLFYRSSWLSFHGITAVVALSAVVDKELLDLRMTIGFGIFALISDGTLALFEFIRDADCPGGVTQLDIAICAAAPSRSTVYVWIVFGLAIAALLKLIVAGVWLARRTRELRLQAQYVLYKSARTQRESMDAQIQRATMHNYTAGEAAAQTALNSSGGVLQLIMAVLMLLVCLFIVAVNGVGFRSGAFYQGPFLIVPAHLVGALLGFFGRTPMWWRFVVGLFALLSVASSAAAAIIGWPQFVTCLSSGTFSRQIDRDVCIQDGLFFSAAAPLAFTAAAIFSLVSLVVPFLLRRRTSRRGRRVTS